MVLFYQHVEFFYRDRFGEIKTLDYIAAGIFKEINLFLCLRSFAQDFYVEFFSHVYDTGEDYFILVVHFISGKETFVQLHDVERQLFQQCCGRIS